MVRRAYRNNITHIIIMATGALVLVAIYFGLYKCLGVSFRCLWHDLTGWYCPGCGATRMLWSLIKGDFYQAFRFNPLLFILLPFGIWVLCDKIYCKIKGDKKPLIDKIPSWCWIILIVITIAFGILRNFDEFSALAPTIVD